MKNRFVFSLCFLFASLCVAQEHLTFVDIPIDGTMSEFQSKLIQNGFARAEKDNSFAKSKCRTYNGKFLDYSWAELNVVYSTQTEHVYRVSVNLNKHVAYQRQIVDKLTKEYGEAATSKDELDEYWTWDLTNGTVKIMYCSKFSSLQIDYIDKTNKDKYSNEASQAQEVKKRTPNAHLAILGVQLNGTINDFTTKFTNKGMKISSLNKSFGVGMRVFEGEFSNEQVCIAVQYDSKTKMVNKAIVLFPLMSLDTESAKWSSVISNLRTKYGSENVVDDKVDVDDLMNGLIYQHTVYLEEGKIVVQSKSGDESGKYRLIMIYEDKINTEKIEKAKQQNSMNDL